MYRNFFNKTQNFNYIEEKQNQYTKTYEYSLTSNKLIENSFSKLDIKNDNDENIKNTRQQQLTLYQYRSMYYNKTYYKIPNNSMIKNTNPYMSSLYLNNPFSFKNSFY
ncbi:hypothetical protein BCR32DRAFT_248924 [Anaeromyces robustus]|uniref:Uncharacterized protein n=1 Tax=Anaeromyces robustus TaxID=1754192 RepID=A0A1Y1WSI1_9FUNG|nr:hypothetical protein BCR32DRAFT_248924 [Anaeromyces robustus]|eukprot:ORX76206.1 hypothetical protein BCR32DRAFT_248924 [Anaeromyces robustus]